MGSVYPRRRRWWIKFKLPDGKWKPQSTKFRTDVRGDKERARKLLRRIEDRISAGEDFGEVGFPTVRGYGDPWVGKREQLGLADWKNDGARLRIHVYPRIGPMRIDEVRPRHLADVFFHLRTGPKKKAPRTIRNIYSTVCALFRDARIDGLIDDTPCILTKYQLGEVIDLDPEWRDTAIYERHELEMLISDPLIPWDRQILYALEGIGALRHGEGAGMCWRHYEPSKRPLGRLMVRRSYDHLYTKTKRRRDMPVHPVLAAMLAEWKLSGWPEMMGRPPGPDDLIVPMPASLRISLGEMRTKDRSFKRLRKDLQALELRHRRGHDLRRTMISLARNNGANKDILAWATHGRSKKSTIDDYTTLEWKTLCDEVAKLTISRREHLVAVPAVKS